MSKALHSILLAIELATRQRDALARKYAQAIRSVDFATGQMAQLQGYANEIDARWGNQRNSSLTVEMLHHHYQFRDRLQHAVSLQVGTIAKLQEQQDAAQQALLKAQYRLAGLGQVLASRQATLQQAEQRREQRAMDEFAAQIHARKASLQLTGEHT